jgi:hypothetical protein
MTKNSWLVFVFLLLQPCMSLGATVKQFLPQGRIDQQTRVSAKFSTEMVKLGDTSAPSPFVVNCAKVGGEGRWVDASNWAWQMKRPLKSGERCEFVLRSDRVALNGEALSGKNRFEFFMPGPWPRAIFPRPKSSLCG